MIVGLLLFILEMWFISVAVWKLVGLLSFTPEMPFTRIADWAIEMVQPKIRYYYTFLRPYCFPVFCASTTFPTTSIAVKRPFTFQVKFNFDWKKITHENIRILYWLFLSLAINLQVLYKQFTIKDNGLILRKLFIKNNPLLAFFKTLNL